MPPEPAHLAQYCRDEAARIRALADLTMTPDTRANLLMIANQFDRLAQQHERHFRDQTKPEPDPERRSILEEILAEQEAKLPADGDRIRRWRMKAEELHVIADQMADASAQASLRRTAGTYDKLAVDAEARSTGTQPAPTKDAG
jgi:hypothetical protein